MHSCEDGVQKGKVDPNSYAMLVGVVDNVNCFVENKAQLYENKAYLCTCMGMPIFSVEYTSFPYHHTPYLVHKLFTQESISFLSKRNSV